MVSTGFEVTIEFTFIYNEEQNKPTICWFIGKLGVLERGKTHPQNAASLFTFDMLFLKV